MCLELEITGGDENYLYYSNASGDQSHSVSGTVYTQKCMYVLPFYRKPKPV